MERAVEGLLYASRWILAPVLMGLPVALTALGYKFFQEVFHLVTHVDGMPEADLVLVCLSLIDLALVGSLLVMVTFSSYENFVSRLDIGESPDKLSWLGKLDAGSLKLKVASSIVAISSIQLLKTFMNVERTPDDKLVWYVVIHLTFVVSAFGLAIMDKMMKKL